MPRAQQLMQAAIPNMPPAMKNMLPGVAPLVAPQMTAYLENEARKKEK
ncbi:hypothetical protein ACFLTG_02475 [Chloroflexota bacterium]